MRGKENQLVVLLIALGITPAYAGKRSRGSNQPTASRDHPRVCGEKVICSSQVTTASGSPPRMRGKVAPDGALIAGRGITPAYAGKSRSLRTFRRGTWDHPRVCGEKAGSSHREYSLQGSPPRMRGKGERAHRDVLCAGITPAYAGKSPGNRR